MTLLSYQVLKTVADQGSFRKAAELLGLTPSAVSHAVSSMEKELGFFVFNRGKNGVMLTNYGERLLPYVNAVLNSDESLQQAVAEFNGLKQGRIKIGCFSSVCTNWMPELIHAFAKSYPAIEMEIFQGTYDDVSYWIKNGVVDVGFLSVSSAGEIPIVPLYKDSLLCVVPKGLRTRQGRVEVEELREYQFVTQRESTDADIQNFMKEHDLNVTSNYHVVDDLSTVAMVAHGFGICLMPEMVMQDIPYEVDCFHLKEDAYRIIGLAALDFEAMAPAVRMFYEQVVENYKQPLD